MARPGQDGKKPSFTVMSRTAVRLRLKGEGANQPGEEIMRFILMMHAPMGTGEYQIGQWAPEDLQAHIGHMHKLNKELMEAGELVGAEGLAPPGEARLVRSSKDGRPAVTDGPFPEAKEFLVGYWLIDVPSAERAHEIAARASSAPGPGGQPMNMPIEVRQVMRAPLPPEA
jgi:hypothetical protein